ncbi:MAG: stage II sporulation protein D [Bacillota bacterium]|nr:stage II sporulation protein D [Bacillota bacterium]
MRVREQLQKWRRGAVVPALLRHKKLLYGLGADVALALLVLVLLPGLLVLFFGEKEASLSREDGGDPLLGFEEVTEISLYRQSEGRVVSLGLEEYVAGVVAGEMPSSFETEALKAQAVAARTYGVSKVRRAAASGNSADHPDAPLCDGTHCQVYRSETELRELKGEDWMANGWLKIRGAVADTAGKLMYYQGALVEQPLFHSASGGRTENSEDVFVSAYPYLRSVDSAAYETEAPYQNESFTLSVSGFAEKITGAYGAPGELNQNTVKVTATSEGGRVESIQVGSLSLTGRQLRELLGLRSANFTVSFAGDGASLTFTTRGYGHGVGMSQYGANGMARAGFSYTEILQHYYSGIEVH